MRIKLGMSN